MIRNPVSFGLAPAAVLTAACSGKDTRGTADSTSTSSSASSTTTTASTTMQTPAPTATNDAASAPADPAHFTDANILAKENTGDSGEVAMATMAKGMATSAAVKRYADRLIADHSKGRKEVAALAQKLSITPQTAAGDTSAQAISHAFTRLQGLPKGAAFDTAFVNHEIEDHQQDITDAQAMTGATKDAQVKAILEKSLPELRKHLDEAQKLSRSKS